MVDISIINSEYEKNGYSPVFEEKRSLSILIKAVDSSMRAVAIIRKGAFNIRSVSDIRYVVQEKLRTVPSINVDAKNLFIVVWGNDGSGHHYMGFNSVYFNITTDRLSNRIVSKRFYEEMKILNNLLKFKRVDTSMRTARHPEDNLCIPWAVYVVIAVTCIAYYFIKDQWDTYAMTSNALVDGQSYRFVTSLAMHGNIGHLLGNMAALYIVGRIYAKVEGNTSFLLVYICSGITANFTEGLYKLLTGFDLNVSSAGASSAIMAIIGAIMAETFVHSDFERSRVKIIITCLLYFAICSIGKNVNITGHLLGLMYGIFFGFLAKILTLLEDELELRRLNAKKNIINNNRGCND